MDKTDQHVSLMRDYLAKNNVQRVTPRGLFVPKPNCTLSENFEKQAYEKARTLLGGQAVGSNITDENAKGLIVAAATHLNLEQLEG